MRCFPKRTLRSSSPRPAAGDGFTPETPRQRNTACSMQVRQLSCTAMSAKRPLRADPLIDGLPEHMADRHEHQHRSRAGIDSDEVHLLVDLLERVHTNLLALAGPSQSLGSVARFRRGGSLRTVR